MNLNVLPGDYWLLISIIEQFDFRELWQPVYTSFAFLQNSTDLLT